MRKELFVRVTVVSFLLLSSLCVLAQERKSFEDISYFPLSTYYKLDKLDSMRFIMKSDLLLNFGEEKLFRRTDNSMIYRLTWLRSFDEPMIFTLENYDTEIVLTVKIGNKIGSLDNSYYDYSKLRKRDNERFHRYLSGELDSIEVIDIFSKKGFYVRDTVRFKYTVERIGISNSEFTTFKALLTTSNFWTTKASLGSMAYHDGARWVIEGYEKSNGYHVVDRHSPSANGNDRGIREIGEYLIRQYGKVDEEKIY